VPIVGSEFLIRFVAGALYTCALRPLSAHLRSKLPKKYPHSETGKPFYVGFDFSLETARLAVQVGMDSKMGQRRCALKKLDQVTR
jgi:hypothetical protein